ncbi:flagellar biosynthesis regulator FlaF [Roseomonas sp. 18066]|uniref:flagellar biosynthesis regulator FlaF n=1 Tax=Roseomonas sp. 18066 TaxID=2681412 RepID=UPI001357B8BB|nr:flagellar biosynthesis regulator FlaF [Roseomonas sp. 18066]
MTLSLAPAATAARANEAAAFEKVLGLLTAAHRGGEAARAQALRMNDKLWQAILQAVARADSALALPMRQGLAALGVAVLREQGRAQPNLDLLVAINQRVLAGLATRH